MKRALLGLLVACSTLGLASVALAGENANAGISLHLTSPTNKAANCTTSFTYKTSGNDPFKYKTKDTECPGGESDWVCWLVVCNASDSVGVAGAEFGLDYDGADGSGADIEGWKLCADLEFPMDGWPAAGTGNLVTWEPSLNCQRNQLYPGVAGSGFAVIGYVNVHTYGSDVMEIVGRQVTGYLKVADCNAVEDDLTSVSGGGKNIVERGGRASFCGGGHPYSYCKRNNLAGGPTTWGAIKSMYSN
jgi:hypothetical protein